MLTSCSTLALVSSTKGLSTCGSAITEGALNLFFISSNLFIGSSLSVTSSLEVFFNCLFNSAAKDEALN